MPNLQAIGIDGVTAIYLLSDGTGTDLDPYISRFNVNNFPEIQAVELTGTLPDFTNIQTFNIGTIGAIATEDTLNALSSKLPTSLGEKIKDDSISVTPATGAVFALNTTPLNLYEISDLDEGATAYYGYTDKDENWVIKQVTSTTIRYCVGVNNYTTAWTNRASQTYSYFHQVF